MGRIPIHDYIAIPLIREINGANGRGEINGTNGRGRLMEQTELNEQLKSTPADEVEAHMKAHMKIPTSSHMEANVSPQGCANSDGKGKAELSYVYAIGRIETRFPTLGVEKEFAQAMDRENLKGFTDQQALHSVLSKPENRYLMHQVCWVFTIEGIEAYILQPRDSMDFNLLMDAIRQTSHQTDVDVVIGIRGPISQPEVCNGLMVPIVLVDQTYSFDVDSLIKSIPRPENISEEKFGPAAEELFNRIMQMADNAGATDENRALNYLAVRYPAIYAVTSDQFGKNFSLTAVEVLPSRMSGTRKIVNVVFTYTNRQTDVDEKFFVRVDVTEEFPFLVTKMSPYYDR